MIYLGRLSTSKRKNCFIKDIIFNGDFYKEVELSISDFELNADYLLNLDIIFHSKDELRVSVNYLKIIDFVHSALNSQN